LDRRIKSAKIEKVVIPHGDTTIQKGDHLVTLVSANCLNEARAALHSEAESLMQ